MDGQSAMRIMQIVKKLEQSIWIILTLPSRGEAVDLHREEIGAIAGDIADSLEAIEEEIQY